MTEYGIETEGLVDGPKADDMLVLLGVALLAFLLTVFFFQRRNLSVRAWPWQRSRVTA